MEDRLSDLPEELKLRILGCLDIKYAVQTSVLSRSWVSLWARVPVMEINNFCFQKRCNKFHKFVKEILYRRDPVAKLDTLKFNHYNDNCLNLAWCRAKILKHVFAYAFSHGVKHLEASIDQRDLEINSWPVCLCEALTSLKLQSKCQRMRCPFLGPTVLFKNLTVLYLERAFITDVEPFSGFPVLENLTLLSCHLFTCKGNESRTFKVHALRLSDLTISNCIGVQCWELSTPRLRFFKYRGSGFLKHEGLPVLETLGIDTDGPSYYRDGDKEGEKRKFDYLMSFFSTIPNIKSLTLFSSTVILLSSFPNELATRGSSFPELKDLIFRCRYESAVKAYLLRNSPHATIT